VSSGKFRDHFSPRSCKRACLHNQGLGARLLKASEGSRQIGVGLHQLHHEIELKLL
jgi:hypothetical protein